MIGLLWLAACGELQEIPPLPEATSEAPSPQPEVSVAAPLPPALLLRRASLDLRGVVPTLDELALVEADPAALDGLVDSFLEDPRWEGRLADLWAEHLLTRVDNYLVGPEDYGIPYLQRHDYVRAVGDEAPRLMAHIGVADLPFSDVVTADYTMAHEVLVGHWPLDYPEGGTGWQVARYTDGRPALGVLATGSMWWRYYTTASGRNRSRAEAVARLFLCESFLERPIRFVSAALVASEELTEATRTLDTCVTCHNTLDPLAGAFFGFWVFDIYDPTENATYHPEREQLGNYYLGVDPAYYGAPIDAPVDLGGLVAGDPRFYRCMARTMATLLWRRPADPYDDFAEIDHFVEVFRQGDWRLRPLVREILRSEAYTVGALTEGATEADQAALPTRRLLPPEVLADAVEDLTSLRWTEDNFDQLTSDERGYRVLAGGIDGDGVTQRTADPTVTQALVLQRLAQAAGPVAVAREIGLDPSDRRLFGEGDLRTLRPGDIGFTDELVTLHRRLHSLDPSAEALARDTALWEAVFALEGAQAAWAAVLTALLCDPAFWMA